MAKLILNPTSSSRRDVPLARATVSIGRDPTNDLVLPDAMVSRRHALIELRGTQYFLRDCNSSNGSLVNGDRVSESALKDGDLLAIGASRMLFREAGEAGVEDAGPKVIPHPSAARLECPNCHGEFRGGDQFCRQCGAQLIERVTPKVLCASCGSVVTQPAKFCNVCGTGLPRGPEVLEVTKPQPALRDEPEAELALTPVEPAPALAAASPALLPPPLLPTAMAPVQPVGPAAAVGPRPVPPPAAVAVARPAVPAPRRPLPRAPIPANAGLRLMAATLDAGLVFVGQAIILTPVFIYWWSREMPGEVPFVAILLSVLLALAALLLGAVYYVYFWGVQGATPGKRAFGLAVVDQGGRCPVGAGVAALRLIGYGLSALPLGLGFVFVPVTGRGLHDRMAGTIVVQREKA